MSLTDSPDGDTARHRFHSLEIADVRRETEDAVSIAFSVPARLHEAFRFVPGQYLTLKTNVGGEEVRRTYSISSGLDEREWRVAIKRVDGGLFSHFANENLHAGDVIDVMPPAGRFVLPAADGPRTVVAFAAGSGITPISSQLRTVLVREPDARVFLFYGNQTSRSILFREAFEDLKDRYMDRFSVHNVLSREKQDVSALNGRIDGEKVAAFMRHVVSLDTVDVFLLCGPAPFLNACVERLTALGVPKTKLLMERFTTPKGRPQVDKPTANDSAVHTVTVTIDGTTTELKLGPGERVLDAAINAGLDVPYSCRGGMCCTCRAKVTDGAVDMSLNYSLRDDELASGFVLTCQSTPTTKSVSVDYDAA